MRRLNRFKAAKMLSARIEKSDAELFENLISKQVYLSLQDFVGFSIRQFISGNIYVDGTQFAIKK